MSLIENTLFGERDRVAIAIEMLKTFEPKEGYFVAYSGGKDSTVILDLVRRSGVKYDAHYNRTTVDPPELVYFVRLQPDVIDEAPEMSMWDLIPKMGMPPTRLVRYCCRVLKEHGGTGRITITGVRAAESARRAKRRQMETCYQDSTKTFLHLIFDWSTKDVWEYIRSNNLPYCKLYDEGYTRLGCLMCPMANVKNQQRDTLRYPKYKELYIEAFDKMVEKQKKGKGCRWNNGQEVWDWWTSAPKKKDCDKQTYIFD